MIEAFKQNKFLVSLITLVSLGVLIFNVVYYSKSYGIVEINNVNAMLLVPFIILVYWFGIALGTSKNIDKLEIGRLFYTSLMYKVWPIWYQFYANQTHAHIQ
jgi:hypothetical protein